MTYIGNYIVNNRKRNLFTIIGITLSSILLLSVGILFSSLREYLINNVREEIGDYHVIINGNVSKYDFILSKEYKNERYYIIFKNIYDVYKNTKEICNKERCEGITYNNSLLSLYGISRGENILNTFKKIIYFLVFILSIIVFFIIYNSYKASLCKRRWDISSFKLIGMDNSDLYKLFFKESLIIGLIGIVLGFLLSIFINFIVLKIINSLLYEFFKGKLFLKIYFPFIFIPFLFMFLIIILSSFMPLKDIKKYKAMELFRKKDSVDKVKVKLYKNFILWLTIINYKRSKDKYKGLIICIFILVISINIFSLVFEYGLECIDKYVSIPEYDLRISLNGNYDELFHIAKDLKASKKNIFKSCEDESFIPKRYFLNDYKDNVKIVVTNIGGNEIINKVDKIDNINNKISYVSYKRFKNLKEITLEDNIKLSNLSLTNNIPFGLKETNDVVINLDKEEFNKICPEYTGNLYLNTNYKGLDNYLDKIISKNKLNMAYINVKKVREIMNNLVLIIKIFLHGILILIFIVMILSTLNTIFISIDYRSRELSSLESIGLEPNSIKFSFLLESLIISFKGWFYSIPFIFIINKYIFSGIREVFSFKKIILNLDILFLSLFISFITIFLIMLLSYKNIRKRSLISNIKNAF